MTVIRIWRADAHKLVCDAHHLAFSELTAKEAGQSERLPDFDVDANDCRVAHTGFPDEKTPLGLVRLDVFGGFPDWWICCDNED